MKWCTTGRHRGAWPFARWLCPRRWQAGTRQRARVGRKSFWIERRGLRRGWRRLIRREDLAAAGGEDVEMAGADQACKIADLGLLRQEVIPLRLKPKVAETWIVQENAGSTRSGSTVFEIQAAVG